MLRSEAARTARKRIVATCAEGHDQATLLTRVAPLVAEAVPFDAAGLTACDPDTLMPTAGHAPGMPIEACRGVLENELFAVDVNKVSTLARQGRTAALLSEATRGELHRSPRYRTLMAPFGHEHELRVAFLLDDRCWGSACFVRDGSRPDFSANEVAYVASLSKHVAQGLCGALAHGEVRDARPLPDRPGFLVVDDDCRILRATPEAERWLVELQPSWRGIDDVVPGCVRSVVARARAAHVGGGAAEPPRVRIRSRDEQWVVVHASHLTGVEREWAVVLEPARPSETVSLIADAHGLTRREREVFGMLLRGLTDREMAEQLVVSPHTQREHAKRVLQKLGVRNRTELVLRIFAEHQAPAF